MTPLRLIGVASLVWLSACSTTRQTAHTPVRYRLALSAGTSSAPACLRHCDELRDAGGANYAECLAACPGVEVTPNAACSADDFPPVAECVIVHADLDEQSLLARDQSGHGDSTSVR